MNCNLEIHSEMIIMEYIECPCCLTMVNHVLNKVAHGWQPHGLSMV